MKILLVSGPDISLKEPYSSGIESFIVLLATQLIKNGHSVDVIAHDADKSVPFTIINPFIRSADIKYGWLRMHEEQKEFSGIDISAYDVVHYNMFYPHLYKAGYQFDKPSMLTLHSPKSHKRIKSYEALRNHTNATFVSISERSKYEWDKGLRMPTTMIENGIDISLWPSKQSVKGKYLLWSARINSEKNPLAAIKLAKHLKLPLKIAGRITDSSYFDTYVRPYLNDTIEYVGHVTQHELSWLAQDAAAYLATATWQEPFGLAALEMLASGVPVVGFETAVPTNWSHKSVSVVASYDWYDLINAFQSTTYVKPDECRAFAASMSVEHMVAEYIELYDSMMTNETFTRELIDFASNTFTANQGLLTNQPISDLANIRYGAKL